MEMIFGGSGLVKEAYDLILNNIPINSTILELGSGHISTKYLSEKYSMISIESNSEFIGLYNSKYFYASTEETGWYDLKAISMIPKDYKALIIDGPGNRDRFLEHLEFFNLSCFILVDDIYRKKEMRLFTELCKILNRKNEKFEQFGVIYP